MGYKIVWIPNPERFPKLTRSRTPGVLCTKMRQFSLSDAVIDTVNSTASFTVTVNPASSNSVSVSFATFDGSAVSSVDYVSTFQTVSFAPGQTQQTVTVPLLTSNAGGKQFFGLLTAP
jgi:Calx-beta domain-containing protein